MGSIGGMCSGWDGGLSREIVSCVPEFLLDRPGGVRGSGRGLTVVQNKHICVSQAPC